MNYHISAFFLGFLMDLLLGDPYWMPHPIRGIGRLVSGTEHLLTRHNETDTGSKKLLRQGRWLVLMVLLVTFLVTTGILLGAYRIHPWFGAAIEMIMTYQILATKCLKKESMKVYSSLCKEGLVEARRKVAMIVGRDTECLDEEGVIRAAVETVAENTSDGSIAPMLYLAVGGPVLGFCYKAVNTMDSMVGYKNDRYLYLGRAAAKLDDMLNYLPARISALLMIGAAWLSGKEYSGKNAFRIYKRDRRKHASPNAAHTEAVCAGALGLQLAGNASYFGKLVEKPYIGDAERQITREDIIRANHLLYVTAWLCEIICLFFLLMASCFIHLC